MTEQQPSKPSEGHPDPGQSDQPAESVVVVELGSEPPSGGWAFLGVLERPNGVVREVILVCRRSALATDRPPGWVRVVPLPDDEPLSFAQARQLGVVQASGDVIRLVTALDLTALLGGEPQFSTEGWSNRLSEHGIAPPDVPETR